MRRGGYTIHTTDGDRPMTFHTVAGSANEAERIFRRVHRRWRRPIRIEEPAFPSTSEKKERPKKAWKTRRKS